MANTIAIADRLPLSDADTAPRSFRKALRGIERGLAELALVRSQPPGVVLGATPALDLFREKRPVVMRGSRPHTVVVRPERLHQHYPGLLTPSRPAGYLAHELKGALGSPEVG